MRKILLTLTLLIISIFVVACGNDSTEPASKEPEANKDEVEGSQEIIYATTSDAPGLSPIDTNDGTSASVIIQIYETLFVLDPDTMEPEPLLAESYDTPDDLTWEIKLREGIEFHDGTPFNAEAVKYTFDQLKDPDRAAPRASLLAPITEVEVVDEYTVALKTDEPYGPMLSTLSHSNASIVSPTADQEGDINMEPVGTGPFVLDEWVQGDSIVLAKNEEYWRDPAKLDKVTYRIVPAMSTAMSMLETGEAHFVKGITANHLSRVENMAETELQMKEGVRVQHLEFNTEVEPFNDLVFRQAISHAINTEAYVEQLNGLGVHNKNFIGPKIFGYNEDDQNEAYDYNPEKAKELIEQSGFSGETLKITASNSEDNVQMAEIVQHQLSEVGLDVEIELLELGAFAEAARGGDFQMAFMGWANNVPDASELLDPKLHSNHIGSTNLTRYNNPDLDKLIEEGRFSVDQDYRLEKIREAYFLAMKEAPWLVMKHEVVTLAHHESIKGLVISPNEEWRLYNVSVE